MKRKVVIVALLAFLALYLGVALLLYLFQAKLIFFPRRELVGTPALMGLAFENEAFQSSDGVQLHGWYIPADHRRGTVLFCHGNGGNISYLLETLRTLNRLGLSVFAFDYRGYGESSGTPGEEGMYRDAEAAWKVMTGRRGIPGGQIIIMGRSLGGAVAAWLATRVTPAGLIVESSFTSLPDIAADSYPIFPARLMTRFAFATQRSVENIHVPLLVIHSPDDEIVPFEYGKKIFGAAPEPKVFLEISGRHNHGFTEDEQRYREGIGRFVERTMHTGEIAGPSSSISYLALGDSYTIGEGIRGEGRWPVQLARELRRKGLNVADPVIVAKTGWTTEELIENLNEGTSSYSLVSLLIGVNDQYRGEDPEAYRKHFRALLGRAIAYTGGEPSRVIVVSIPDWGVTTFAEGRDRRKIAREIDLFNNIAEEEARAAGAPFVDITGLSREHVETAPDGLHPSEAMYARWVERIAPEVIRMLGGR